MKKLEDIERHLPANVKLLLYGLREENWEVVRIDDGDSGWALVHKWTIHSTRENRGFTLILSFFKYEGQYDGTDCVIATLDGEPEPSPYFGDISIYFDKKPLQAQVKLFLSAIHELRIKT